MEDEKIVELYFERNERALSEAAQKYGAMIRRIAYNITKNVSDSEECENDTYHISWNKIPPERPKYLSAFLGRIARNVSFDKYAYNNAAKRKHEFDVSLSEIEDCIPSAVTIETEEEQRMLAEIISSYLRSISRTKRVIFIRRYWYCDSISELSNAFGFSEGKIKSMLFRTRNELKQYLEREGIQR